jgi:pyruvate dehydrogenase E1 component
MLHPESDPRTSYVESCLKDRRGPVIAATDYMKSFADQIRAFMPDHQLSVLGTDGFGRSDSREQLRHFFEVDRYHVAVAALKALADQEALPRRKVTEAIEKYKLDPEKPDPAIV